MWEIEYIKRFLKDIAVLPVRIQTHVKSIVFQELESEKPFN